MQRLEVSGRRHRDKSAILGEPNIILMKLMYMCYVMKTERSESGVWIPSVWWDVSVERSWIFQLIHLTTQAVSILCFHLFCFHDVAHVHQFHQDYNGLPEDSTPNAPKHVGAR
jgi:hypothetical protein